MFREDAFESAAKEDACCRILAATVLYAPHVVEHLFSLVWFRVEGLGFSRILAAALL